VGRAREFRADALAARACGTLICIDSLKKSHAYGSLFSASILQIEEQLQSARTADTNSLRVWRKNLQNLASVAQKMLSEELAQQTNRFDSHPSLRERIENLPPVPNRYEQTQPALSLLKELAKHEKMAGEFFASEYRLARRNQLGL
jgi:Zn-dependent protease with chaperone function